MPPLKVMCVEHGRGTRQERDLEMHEFAELLQAAPGGMTRRILNRIQDLDMDEEFTPVDIIPAGARINSIGMRIVDPPKKPRDILLGTRENTSLLGAIYKNDEEQQFVKWSPDQTPLKEDLSIGITVSPPSRGQVAVVIVYDILNGW